MFQRAALLAPLALALLAAGAPAQEDDPPVRLFGEPVSAEEWRDVGARYLRHSPLASEHDALRFMAYLRRAREAGLTVDAAAVEAEALEELKWLVYQDRAAAELERRGQSADTPEFEAEFRRLFLRLLTEGDEVPRDDCIDALERRGKRWSDHLRHAGHERLVRRWLDRLRAEHAPTEEALRACYAEAQERRFVDVIRLEARDHLPRPGEVGDDALRTFYEGERPDLPQLRRRVAAEWVGLSFADVGRAEVERLMIALDDRLAALAPDRPADLAALADAVDPEAAWERGRREAPVRWEELAAAAPLLDCFAAERWFAQVRPGRPTSAVLGGPAGWFVLTAREVAPARRPAWGSDPRLRAWVEEAYCGRLEAGLERAVAAGWSLHEDLLGLDGDRLTAALDARGLAPRRVGPLARPGGASGGRRLRLSQDSGLSVEELEEEPEGDPLRALLADVAFARSPDGSYSRPHPDPDGEAALLVRVARVEPPEPEGFSGWKAGLGEDGLRVLANRLAGEAVAERLDALELRARSVGPEHVEYAASLRGGATRLRLRRLWVPAERRDVAERALARLESGEPFALVAGELGRSADPTRHGAVFELTALTPFEAAALAQPRGWRDGAGGWAVPPVLALPGPDGATRWHLVYSCAPADLIRRAPRREAPDVDLGGEADAPPEPELAVERAVFHLALDSAAAADAARNELTLWLIEERTRGPLRPERALDAFCDRAAAWSVTPDAGKGGALGLIELPISAEAAAALRPRVGFRTGVVRDGAGWAILTVVGVAEVPASERRERVLRQLRAGTDWR